MTAPGPALEPPPVSPATEAAPAAPGSQPSAPAGPWRLPPGLPRPLHFYFGKPWFRIGRPILLFDHLLSTYGPVAHYRFLGTTIVFINKPEYIREILVNQAGSFVKERTMRRMKVLLGEGLLTADDPEHMRQRKLIAPAFHRQRIAGYAEEIVRSAVSHIAPWQPDQTIDISASMMDLSLHIVARTLFDTEVTDDVRSINREVNTVLDLYNFLVIFPKLESVLHLPIPGVTRFRRARARIDSVVNRMVADRRAEIEADPSPLNTRGDLLSMLIASRYEEDGASAPSGMSDKQIRDEVLTIFIAGYETVANALAWTWYLLSQNPAAEAELLLELDSVLGSGTSRRLPTLADLPGLRYTEQVFAEAMRLYPPAWAMGRMSNAPVELGPFRFPPGAHFFFSQYMVHRSPDYFPDPLRFDPSRHSPENKAGRDKFAYFPFGGGSRQCIGEGFAWMEGILAIATIAHRWRMEYTGPNPPETQAKITLRPKHPLPMRLQPR